MYKRCVIHCPADEKDSKRIYKEIAAFRSAASVQYVRSLNLNDRQIEALFDELQSAAAAKRAK